MDARSRWCRRRQRTPKRTKTNQAKSDALAAYRRRLRQWYRLNGRHSLAWRETRDPYAVLVSELMLQQTQVERVAPYYVAWMKRWPTFAALAASTASEVITAWAGLGYNRRALGLWRLAGIVWNQLDGQLPRERPEMELLPGIGPYTAAAISSFAFGDRVAVVDTNVGRLLARTMAGVERAQMLAPAQLRTIAQELLPARGVRDHNLALMDLGAVVCRARAPLCDRCPVRVLCCWRLAGSPPGSPDERRRATPFEASARFARGRIVDALRTSPEMTFESLGAMFGAEHRNHLHRYIAGLEADGLIERAGRDRWRLPQGRMSMASPKL